jgi:hypothetical protein
MNQADPYYDSKERLVLYNFVHHNGTRPIFFRFKPTSLISQSPMFDMNDKDQSANQVHLVSLPMLATYLNLQSVNQISYRRLVIRLKDD